MSIEPYSGKVDSEWTEYQKSVTSHLIKSEKQSSTVEVKVQGPETGGLIQNHKICVETYKGISYNCLSRTMTKFDSIGYSDIGYTFTLYKTE